jgi:formylglycine-generating enzyme required for sulfatase activity
MGRDKTMQEAIMTTRRAHIPAALTIAGVLFVLVMSAPLGSAEAQTFFFVQGEAGPAGEPPMTCDATTCALDRDLAIDGSFTNDELAVQTSYRFPECPEGYVQDATVTDFVLCTDGADEMVKVGDFWVDRYEASVWENEDCTGTQYGDTDDWAAVDATFPASGQYTVPLFACSVSGVTPAAYGSWFRAQAACVASGEHLITSAEWQQAVEGTADPGAVDGAGGVCVTQVGGWTRRATGDGTACVSTWGAEDMIGNVIEYVADWYQGGQDWVGVAFADGTGAEPWPASYGDGADRNWNLDGRAYQGGYRNALPAAAMRGGSLNQGEYSGAFELSLDHAPSEDNLVTGFRCARSR